MKRWLGSLTAARRETKLTPETTPSAPDMQASGAPVEDISLRALFRLSLRTGCLSFGGPAAQIAMLHRAFVDERKWLSEERFLHALNFCMLLPGPEAQQLATYCGWLARGTAGGLISGLMFILPGALVMFALSWLYVLHGETGLLAAIFYGIKGGILAIVLEALLRVSKRALKTPLAWGIALATFLGLFVFSLPFPLLIGVAACVGALFLARSSALHQEEPPTASPTRAGRTLLQLAGGAVLWLAPPLALASVMGSPVLEDIARFFSTLAIVSFGGAYALLSYMAQVVVETEGWLSAGQVLDGLGLAETTPGPLILVTQFIGFLAGWQQPGSLSPMQAASLAALVTTWVTFVPSFVLVLAGAPWMERLRGNRRLSAALAGITAAVTGTILNLALWFALNVLFTRQMDVSAGPVGLKLPDLSSFDPKLALIALTAGVLVFWLKAGAARVIALTALMGLAATRLI